jgi:hypothetical protein
MPACTSAIAQPLNPGGRDALHEEALEGEKDDKDRDERHDGGGHDQAVLGRVLGDEHAQPDLDGLELGLGQVDQRPEEIVPGRDEGEDRRASRARASTAAA